MMGTFGAHGTGEKNTEFLCWNLKERYHPVSLGIDGMLLLNYTQISKQLKE
jgi:hypothetical protein